jgi:hypothetical protein
MTKSSNPDPELRAFLASFHGKRARIFLTSGQDTTGIVNTTTWDEGRPSSIYLVSTEDPELAAVLIPWHAVAAVGKLLDPTRPRARGDETGITPPAGVPVLDPAHELTDAEADRLIEALRAENPAPGPISGGFRP